MGDWPAAHNDDNEMLKGEGGKTDLAGDGAGSVAIWCSVEVTGEAWIAQF